MFIFIIKEKREEKGITQEELAKRSGLTQNYISYIENNEKRNPSFNSVYKIAKALNEKIDDLIITTSDIEKVRELMHKSIEENGINSEKTLKISRLLDKLILLKMEKNGMS